MSAATAVVRTRGGWVLVARLTLVPALGVALLACSGAGSPGPTGAARPSQSSLSATLAADLDAAVEGLNTSRGALLADAAVVGAAAGALDAADEAAATGVLATTRAQVAAVPSGAASAAGRLRDDVAAYARALATLEQVAASAGVPPAARDALRAVTTQGAAEAAAGGTFAAAGAQWQAYGDLDAALRTWLTRRTAGWYRSEAEAAAAYAVLTGPVRPRLDALRPQVAAADEAQATASRAAATALRDAAAVLSTVGGATPAG